MNLPDQDLDPDTVTVETGGLDLGTHTLLFDCGGGLTAQARVFVYRQNGAERGEANSIVVAGGVGLFSTAALVGLPTGRRRRARPTASARASRT